PSDLIPEQRVDALVPGTALSLPLAEELMRLEPFGQGNPEPTLLVPAARVGEARSMGEDGQHCRFTLRSGGTRAGGVAFRTGARWRPVHPWLNHSSTWWRSTRRWPWRASCSFARRRPPVSRIKPGASPRWRSHLRPPRLSSIFGRRSPSCTALFASVRAHPATI